MSSLRYVGPTPGSSEGIVVYRDVQNRVQTLEVNQVDYNARANSLSASYMIPSEVDSAFSDRATKSSVASATGQYIDSSAPGSLVATLSSGKIPTAQLPTAYQSVYVEPSGGASKPSLTETTLVGTIEMSVGYSTVSYPGYDFRVLVFGTVEVQTSGYGAYLAVKDSQGRLVGEGYTARTGTYSAAKLTTVAHDYRYSASERFTVYCYSSSASGGGKVTGWEAHCVVVPIPL